MRDFEFLEPATVSAACQLLDECQARGDEVRIMAGGTALLLAMRQRMLSPSHIVSLQNVKALGGIQVLGDHIRIGALARHQDVARHPWVNQHLPMLAGMAALTANPQVRHQGTLGGNLAYADPATDPSGALLALNASVVLASSQGERTLPMQDFLVDYFTTALAPNELLQAIHVPLLAAPTYSNTDTRASYQRYKRTPAEHRPLVNVSLVASAQGKDCSAIRLVLGACVPMPVRLAPAEALLHGQTITPQLAADAADAATADLDFLDDARGSATYRRDMARVQIRRSIELHFGL